MNDLLSKDEMTSLIDDEIDVLSQIEVDFLNSIRVSLHSKSLKWEYGSNEPFEAWVFADFKERNVGAAYCKGGFGKMGSPWGLIFFDCDSFGMDCGWYSTLKDLINDGWLDDDT